jgi:hypothetical protein
MELMLRLPTITLTVVSPTLTCIVSFRRNPLLRRGGKGWPDYHRTSRATVFGSDWINLPFAFPSRPYQMWCMTPSTPPQHPFR